jgi:hypothetical protein
MSYRLIIDPAAILDIKDSIQWYNEQKSDLGRRFYNMLKQTMARIKKSPESFQIRYKNLRMAPVGKFPFMILFQINQTKKHIAVVAVLHTSRNPQIWKERSE